MCGRNLWGKSLTLILPVPGGDAGFLRWPRGRPDFRLAFVKTVQVQHVPDEELVMQLAAGRQEVLDSLQERYGSALTSLASRQLDRPAAEEIAQDVLLTVWQHAHSFDLRRGTFRAWMLQIARRRIMNELRRRRSRPQLEVDPEGTRLEGLADDAPEVAEQVAGNERRTVVRRALQILPQSQRDAVAMAFLEELTHEEVACAMRVPLGTTKTRIRSGLLRLRAELVSLGVAA
jgi:RNA polymerase sigma factor (sigma-70 family)